MNISNVFRDAVLAAGVLLPATTQALGSAVEYKATPELCEQARAHGKRSWQALSAFDAQNHGGNNFYLMSENQRNDQLKKDYQLISKGRAEPLKERTLETYQKFDNMIDRDKRLALIIEVQRHATINEFDEIVNQCPN